VSIDSPKPDSEQSLKLNLLFLEVLVDSPLALPQAGGAYFRYTSIILGMSHYLGVTPIFCFLWAQMKRIHCKEEHNKTNTSYDNSRGGNNKSNWKKNKTKQTIISQLKRDKNKSNWRKCDGKCDPLILNLQQFVACTKKIWHISRLVTPHASCKELLKIVIITLGLYNTRMYSFSSWGGSQVCKGRHDFVAL
jgi:hypothetical protein